MMTSAHEHHYDRRRAVFNEIQVRQIKDLITEQVTERTAAEIEQIAEAAAEKAVEKMTAQAYSLIGKTVLEKLAWLVGLLVVGAALWAVKNGVIKP